MPITITLPTPGNVIAPFGGFQAQSDFIGPLPSGTVWRVLVAPDLEPTHGTATLEMQLPATSVSLGAQFQPIGQDARNVWRSLEIVADGTTAHVLVELVQPGEVVIDSGTASGPWQSTAALQLQPTTNSSGGFTDADRTVAAQTNFSSFTEKTYDSLTLTELTSGPSGGPVNAVLDNPTFGVIVRLANVPAELQPQTPDGDYWVTTLAVVRIFRGADLMMRVPIHTSSKIVNLYTDFILAAVTQALATQWILNLSVQVTFHTGVTGQVFLQRFP